MCLVKVLRASNRLKIGLKLTIAGQVHLFVALSARDEPYFDFRPLEPAM